MSKFYYGVVERVDGTFGVHEVHVNDDGGIFAISEEGLSLNGYENKDELIKDIDNMLDDLLAFAPLVEADLEFQELDI